MLKKSSSIKKNIKLKKKIKIAIILARFNESITRSLEEWAIKALQEAGLTKEQIVTFEVPGAFEIPLVAQKAALSKKFDGIICLGAVIRGDTPHFDYVCQAVTEGITFTQLQTRVPMAFGVLTTETIKQARARADRTENNKGYEAAKVALEMVELLNKM